ncbi:MAG: hypothetical protein GY710_13125 [Desulfobacteraceae bacterium]|nr:hypothetical protein [Desulfobacteraceae bacterium]
MPKEEKKNSTSFISTQNTALSQYLQMGNSITRLEALAQFGIINLPGRVFDLKGQGLLIQDVWVRLKSGKRVKRYWLEK